MTSLSLDITPNKQTTPPIQIVRCPAEGGHLWAGINPRWHGAHHTLPKEKWCPEHQGIANDIRKAKIGEKTAAAARRYDAQPLPSTRKCFSPDPVDHERGAVLPSSKFYIRKTRARRDGTHTYTLDARCKKCRVREEKERRGSKTEQQRQRRNKQSVARRRKKQKAVNGQKDRRMPIQPFREWLKRFMKETGMTQMEVSQKAKVDDSLISGILESKGRGYVAESTVEKIAVGLDRPYAFSHLYPPGQ